MGNTSYSTTEYDEKLRKAEFDLLLCANIPLEYIQRRNIQFKYGEKGGDQDWVNIRTIIISDKDEFDEFEEEYCHSIAECTEAVQHNKKLLGNTVLLF